MPEYRNYRITCPYCFHQFDHDKVIFRANTKIAPKSTLDHAAENSGASGGLGAFGNLGNLGSKPLKSSAPAKSTNDVDSYFQPFELPMKDNSKRNVDQKLVSFWKERGGSSAYPHRWEYPHIDPNDPARFEAMTYKNCEIANLSIGPDGLVRDNDGFVKRVVDVKSEPTESVTRLCPSCHNPMPLQEYGKYPVVFISVVGVTGAGKTVFLNQLLTSFSDAIEHTGYCLAADNLGEIGMPIDPSRPLPESTDAKLVRPPLAAQLMRVHPKPGEEKGITLVFYDIAGENCVNKLGEPDAAHAKSTIGNYIAFSDGLIFLIDPEQLPPFARDKKARPSDIAQVVTVMNQIRADVNIKDPQWNNVPVAVTIAKSDKLMRCEDIPVDNPLFKHSREEIKGFDKDEGTAINKFLSEFLAVRANATVAPLNSFRLRNFFAVAAITTGIENRFTKFQNEYILDDENAGKFHDLRRWVQDWNIRTPEEREYYRPCQVKHKDGTPIVFDKTISITKDNAEDLVTEIRADHVDCPSIYLSLWDVYQELNLVGYPMSEPAPRRVADPLKWIMWQREMIGPHFVEAPTPKKSPFMSRKRYNELLGEVEESNRIDKCRWYGRPIAND